MDRFVKGFIVMSIFYLGISTVLGVLMLWSPALQEMKFAHSHLNMLGWVSMMIFGVGYHILPRFMGRPLYSNKIGEAHFYLGNLSLMTLMAFHTMNTYDPGSMYRMLTVASGGVQALTLFLFFYNMMMTLLSKADG